VSPVGPAGPDGPLAPVGPLGPVSPVGPVMLQTTECSCCLHLLKSSTMRVLPFVSLTQAQTTSSGHALDCRCGFRAWLTVAAAATRPSAKPNTPTVSNFVFIILSSFSLFSADAKAVFLLTLPSPEFLGARVR
jgi:hypothetical protein